MKYLRLSLPIVLLFSPYLLADHSFSLADKAEIARRATVKTVVDIADKAGESAHTVKEGVQEGAHQAAEFAKGSARSIQETAHNVKGAIVGNIGESAVEVALERAAIEHGHAEEYKARIEQLLDQQKNMETELSHLHNQIMHIKIEIAATQQALNRLANVTG